jgi:hypothetical protein
MACSSGDSNSWLQPIAARRAQRAVPVRRRTRTGVGESQAAVDLGQRQHAQLGSGQLDRQRQAGQPAAQLGGQRNGRTVDENFQRAKHPELSGRHGALPRFPDPHRWSCVGQPTAEIPP